MCRALLPLLPLLLLLLLPPAAASAAPRTLELPLLVRVARCDGAPVRNPMWVRAHLEAAQRVLEPHAIRLCPRLERFEPESCEALDRAGRHAWARHVPAEGVTVLVVKRVRDLDLPSYDLKGVHWRYRGGDAALEGRRYVLLSARATPPVLAHELAHYFGLPHDPAGGNLMTAGPSAPIWRQAGAVRPRPFAPWLTPSQGRRLRASIHRWLRPASRPAPSRTRPD